MKIEVNEKIKWMITIAFIILSMGIVISMMIVYHYSGEINMPFEIDKILIVSSADGKNKSKDEAKWDIDINLYNDIYLKISRNKEFKGTEYLKSVKIDNLSVVDNKDKEVHFYMPNSKPDESLFEYDKLYLFNNSLTYTAGVIDDPKTLKIGNQGGTLIFRTAKENVGNFSIDSKESIKYDGTLLKKANISSDRLKYSIKFDLIIETSEVKYKTTLFYNLPIGKLEDDGTSKFYDEECKNIVFKRI